MTSVSGSGRTAVALLLCASAAHADDAEPPRRPWHGSIAAGGDLLLSGADGDRNRFALELDIKPRSRYGLTLAWRAIEPRDSSHHDGLLIAGVVYEGAAARPRLVLDLHGDAGFDLDRPSRRLWRRPLIGGGIRATLTIWGPFGVIGDAGLYFVIDGIDDSRLQLQSSTLLGLRW